MSMMGLAQHIHTHFLGEEMKYLALVCGIEATIAKFSCIRCKCPAMNHWDMTKEYLPSILEHGQGQ